jgi:hypothetical protein
MRALQLELVTLVLRSSAAWISDTVDSLRRPARQRGANSSDDHYHDWLGVPRQ